MVRDLRLSNSFSALLKTLLLFGALRLNRAEWNRRMVSYHLNWRRFISSNKVERFLSYKLQVTITSYSGEHQNANRKEKEDLRRFFYKIFTRLSMFNPNLAISHGEASSSLIAFGEDRQYLKRNPQSSGVSLNRKSFQ